MAKLAASKTITRSWWKAGWMREWEPVTLVTRGTKRRITSEILGTWTRNQRMRIIRWRLSSLLESSGLQSFLSSFFSPLDPFAIHLIISKLMLGIFFNGLSTKLWFIFSQDKLLPFSKHQCTFFQGSLGLVHLVSFNASCSFELNLYWISFSLSLKGFWFFLVKLPNFF